MLREIVDAHGRRLRPGARSTSCERLRKSRDPAVREDAEAALARRT